MFERIHQKLGTAGFIIAIVALVAALGGTAFAAAKLNGTQKKEVEKIAKKYAGKTGAPGAPGPAGPTGAAGAKGDAGAAGSAGAAGKSVVIGNSAPNCDAGGKTVEVEGNAASKKEICNGEQGEPGEPWTAGGTLPPEATETGAYTITSETGTGPHHGLAQTSLSFPIPLPSEIAHANTIVVEAEASSIPANCENSSHAGAASSKNPEAAPGFLCVFEGFSGGFEGQVEIVKPDGAFTFGAGVSGANLIQFPAEAEAFNEGTWAVTAP